MLKGVILIALILVASAAATNVKRCKNNQPFPLSVDMVGCEEPPCEVIKGTTAVMYVHFVGTKDDTRRITTKLRATTLGLTVPYELPANDADVCTNLMYGATCPIYETEDVVYKLNFYVDYNYPELSVAVEASLMNDEYNDCIACFVVNVKIKRGATNPLMLE